MIVGYDLLLKVYLLKLEFDELLFFIKCNCLKPIFVLFLSTRIRIYIDSRLSQYDSSM